MPQFEKVLNSLLRISNIDVYMIDDVLKILEYINSNFALEKMPVHLENSIKTGNKIA